MQVEHFRAAGTFVEVVDVLCYHMHIEVLLESPEDVVGGIGPDFGQVAAALVVEAVHQFRISREAVGAGHIHHRIVLPQASCITECGDAAFGAYACAGGNHQARFSGHWG